MTMLRSLLLLFLMFSMGNAEIGLVAKCPHGWTNFGVRCYKYFDQPANWVTAEKNCQSLGANLASVHSKQDNELLLTLMPALTHYWLGAHDGEQEGKWLWSDGSECDHTNWCTGEPNNLGGENCLEISWMANLQRCWNDAPCALSFTYVCATDM